MRLADALGVGFEDLEAPGPANDVDLLRLRQALGLPRPKRPGSWVERSVLTLVDGAEDPRRVARVTAAELTAEARETGWSGGMAGAPPREQGGHCGFGLLDFIPFTTAD